LQDNTPVLKEIYSSQKNQCEAKDEEKQEQREEEKEEESD
jgi:hypothetical protein